MEETLNVFLFSRDLVNSILPEYSNYQIPIDESSRCSVEFFYKEELGQAVSAIIEKNFRHIEHAFGFFFQPSSKTRKELCQLSWEVSVQYFEDGYNSKNFLNFCAFLCDAAGRFSHLAMYDEVNYTANIIYTFLMGRILIGEFSECGGWNDLSDAALEILHGDVH